MIANSRQALAIAMAAVMLGGGAPRPLHGAEPVLTLRASPVGAGRAGYPMTIEVHRWSTEAERAPLLSALSAPPPPAPAAAVRGAAPAGRAAGRGGRGGRGAAAPPSPAARLASAIKAAPTVGYVWSGGITGYSIKYAWHAPAVGGDAERLVLVVDRRLSVQGLDSVPAPGAVQDAEFTLIEVRIAAAGTGEARTSLTSRVVVDSAHQTLALDDYASAPISLKVTR